MYSSKLYNLPLYNENNIVSRFFRNQEVDNDKNMTNTLLELLIQSEKKNKELLKENKKLVKINQQQNNIQIKELQTSATQNAPLKKWKNIYKRKVNELKKIFTPGQIKILMSSRHNVRIRWSSEDIISAIALRLLSPKAYTYLKSVKKIPSPCAAHYTIGLHPST